jgi:hypothetical protein
VEHAEIPENGKEIGRSLSQECFKKLRAILDFIQETEVGEGRLLIAYDSGQEDGGYVLWYLYLMVRVWNVSVEELEARCAPRFPSTCNQIAKKWAPLLLLVNAAGPHFTKYLVPDAAHKVVSQYFGTFTGGVIPKPDRFAKYQKQCDGIVVEKLRSSSLSSSRNMYKLI